MSRWRQQRARQPSLIGCRAYGDGDQLTCGARCGVPSKHTVGTVSQGAPVYAPLPLTFRILSHCGRFDFVISMA